MGTDLIKLNIFLHDYSTTTVYNIELLIYCVKENLNKLYFLKDIIG